MNHHKPFQGKCSHHSTRIHHHHPPYSHTLCNRLSPVLDFQLHNNKNGCDQADMVNVLGRDSGHGSRLIDYTQDHHSLLSTYVGRFQTSSTLARGSLRRKKSEEERERGKRRG
uniref:Uncharacterized protein n=1 Tax=Opuntia streptacantha TaxID=393608 RepID=A0A7C9A7Z2_OPUST